jgi:PPK2 family polyphosphate:nucleotide phosphotransferase
MSKEATKRNLDKVKSQVKPERKSKKQDGPSYPTYRIDNTKSFRISKLDPDETEGYTEKQALKELEDLREELHEWQERLYAEEENALLVVLQAMDTGGKDGVGRGVFRGVNPQGVRIWKFETPTDEEKRHDFLWRYHRRVPEAGTIAAYNRSYYEAVMSSLVHGDITDEVAKERYKIINDFEWALTHDRVRIVKFYLHISKDEQKARLEERLNDPTKNWLFSMSDIEERKDWDRHIDAAERAIRNTSTDYAPWYVLPGNNKWFRNLVIARTLVDTLKAMDPQYPPLEEEAKGVKIPD